MKLLHYINRRMSVFLLLLMGLWGLFFYLTVIDEVMDETDDTLMNYREIVVGKILADSTILKTEDQILHSYTIRPITPDEAEDFRERFYDSTVYIETEDEYEPVRVMVSCFRASDLNYYELELRLSTLERDDLIHAIFWYLIVLYAILWICTLIGTRLVLKRIFKPLERLLDWIGQIRPDRPAPPLDNHTAIREFRTLTEAAIQMQARNEKVYEEQKQFIENASHELQTPLAVVRGKLDLLTENANLTEKDLKHIGDIYQSLNRAVQLNKSLLLLSRINNGQFPDRTRVCLNTHIHQIADLLSEVYEDKQMQIQIYEKNPLCACMDESLAHTLINNLIKNAIVHSPAGGCVSITTDSDMLAVSNPGTAPLDSSRMFTRFYKADSSYKDSIGLGLAIIHTIASYYQIDIHYSFESGTHHFVLKFPKSEN